MKKFKYFNIALIAAFAFIFVFASCEQRENWRFPELGNGGFLKFVTQPFSWEGSDISDGTTIVKYHIGEDPASSSFSAAVEDPTGNVSSAEYWVVGNFDGAPADAVAYKTSNTFPLEVGFSTAEMAALFNVDASVFKTGDFFEFMAVVNTNDGKVYIPRTASCDCPLEAGDPNGPGEFNGGTIDGVVLMGGDTGDNFLLPAVWYRVKYLAASE